MTVPDRPIETSRRREVVPAGDRPTYLIRLRPKPGIDGIKALRHALKLLGRRAGLMAVEVIEERENARGR